MGITNGEIKPVKKVELSKLPFMSRHRGFDCKSYALSAVLDWMYESKLIDKKPMPARKREDKDYKGHSIRWWFKHKCHSAVGEVHNLEDMALVARLNDDIVAYNKICVTKKDYLELIKKVIDLGRAPIVFFDVGDDDKPAKDKGISEHSAVVVGYEYDENNKLLFKVTQYSGYYTFDADSLYKSSKQLPKKRVRDTEYFKTVSRKTLEGGWLSQQFAKKYDYLKVALKSKYETSSTNGGLAIKILVLDSITYPVPDMSDLFEKNFRSRVKKL